MNQPTKEQIQWFWEQCGFRKHKDWSMVWDGWLDPNGFLKVNPSLPPIDLNNLFLYAVSAIAKIGRGYIVRLGTRAFQGQNFGVSQGEFQYEALTSERGFVSGEWSAWTGKTGADPALALFWAIYEAFGGKRCALRK